MVGQFRKFTRSLGFDVARFPGAANHWPRLTQMLCGHGVSLVLDVGANTGQYATSLRNNGYTKRIVSFEPLSSAHTQLTATAGSDARWQVAERCAVGAAIGETTINISPESDMSSILPLTDDAKQKFKSIVGSSSESTPVTTLAAEIAHHARDDDIVFVKSDTQGYEAEVLAGLGDAAQRVIGLQLELSLVPIYEGQPDYLSLLQMARDLGFETHLVIPGYFSRHHKQMIEFDVVCFRTPTGVDG